MKDGFIKAAAVSPELRVADIPYNCKVICSWMDSAEKEQCKVTVFPELCLTGYTCQDLFLQEYLLEQAENALWEIASHSSTLDGLFFVGLPLRITGKLYNVCAAVSRGQVLGIVPKSYLPNYNEFYEARHFRSGKDLNTEILLHGIKVPVSPYILFCCREMPSLRVAAEICEDLWVPNPPSIQHCLSGATLIVNPSASDELTGKSDYRRALVVGQSARLLCGYIYASACSCESTQDVVYSGHSLLAENGYILAESPIFSSKCTIADFDLKQIETDRQRMTTFSAQDDSRYRKILFSLTPVQTSLQRRIDPHPFVPSNKQSRDKRCNDIISIQAMGLRKRLQHTGCRCAVIGISGGLDSTLALLVTARAFDSLGLPRDGILAVTMPGFGTTDRTYDNAIRLIHSVGAELMEVPIGPAVLQHFSDIRHNPNVQDVTYENSQARERTLILMDLANEHNGLVIGTGDLSELALGWATYNGDHMSMYAINSSVPKTLVRFLVSYFAETATDPILAETLLDVLDTPVSPELLPPEEGAIAQKTEMLVGPYELHDFFLYHMLRWGSSPEKIFRLAMIAFYGTYDSEFILKWQKTFYRRFFSQQFKRSCLPDGPKVGTVAVSPRGDLRMPSDACATIWINALDNLSGKP